MSIRKPKVSTVTINLAYFHGEQADLNFALLVKCLQGSLEQTFAQPGERLFQTDTSNLFEAYLDSFQDPVERQYHNCSCCKSFLRRFGGLVTLSETGVARSVFWNEEALNGQNIPNEYWVVVRALARFVEDSVVTGLFVWDETTWGQKEAGGFSHFSCVAPAYAGRKRNVLLTPNQQMAINREDHKHLLAAVRPVSDLKPAHVTQAVGMLETGSLNRSDALLPMGKFLQTVQHAVENRRGEVRSRIVWHAVGRAAPGWCSPRGSAFGNLVENIAAGKSVEAVTRAHNAIMAPLAYQRPTAAPAAGNVRQAEQAFEKLGLAPSLRRRPMALEGRSYSGRPATRRPFPRRGCSAQSKPKRPSRLLRPCSTRGLWS